MAGVTDKPWDGSAGRFTDEQYARACVLDRKVCGGEWADAPAKQRYSLPIREPDGTLNRNGVHAAAQRIGQVDACAEAITAAKSKLRSAYKQLGEDAPSSIGGSSEPDSDDKKKSNEALESLAREFGVVPGVARHGEVAMRWNVGPADDTIVRETDLEAGYIATLTGHFAVFNRWTEINSFFEGRFMESLSPGAFSKTFSENRKGMRCLVQHGRDPVVGMKPLGPIRELEEDDIGARYDVPMLDTSYNRDLLPGLKNDLYGASFRFQVVREEVNSDPGRSAHNPEGIEERKITEARVREFGPVTFPAYEDATAGVRSLNDWWLDLDLEMFARCHPESYPVRLAELLTQLRSARPSETGSTSTREAAAGETESEGRTAAPSTKAPGLHRPTLRSGAARSLRTSRDQEVPQWKL